MDRFAQLYRAVERQNLFPFQAAADAGGWRSLDVSTSGFSLSPITLGQLARVQMNDTVGDNTRVGPAARR